MAECFVKLAVFSCLVAWVGGTVLAFVIAGLAVRRARDVSR